MTCQECELKLGMGEDADEHLASCGECRCLAEDLRLNSFALRDMQVRPRMHWEWAFAAAAVLVMAIGISRNEPPEKAPPVKITNQAQVELPVAVKHARRHPARKREAPEPLLVKMFTSDPDVVIYWIVDKKEGYE
ncbi:MAG: hypothetical protein ABSF22_16645 [Bryobacteraceae bacterium]|jgi:hypothetical protein